MKIEEKRKKIIENSKKLLEATKECMSRDLANAEDIENELIIINTYIAFSSEFLISILRYCPLSTVMSTLEYLTDSYHSILEEREKDAD